MSTPERQDDPGDEVSDELEEQLDDLAEKLRDPNRADRTIEDQGVEGSIREGENDSLDNSGV